MINTKQRDLVVEWAAGEHQLLLLFGRNGFNGYHAMLMDLAELEAVPLRFPETAADADDGRPTEVADGRWVILHTIDDADGQRGVSDERLEAAYAHAYAFCQTNGLAALLSNGAHDLQASEDIGRRDPTHDDARVRHLYALAGRRPEIRTTFVNDRDVFVRNPHT